MPLPFRIEVVPEDEVASLANVIVPAFAHLEIETFMGNTNDPSAIQAAGQRHLRTWKEHKAETGEASTIKCVHIDPETGKESIAACANWYLYSTPRSPQQTRYQNYLLNAEWLPLEDGKQEKAKAIMKPVLDGRLRWLSGRGHAILQYMATDKAWRRQGAATACVKWGLERCEELGVPAYLEASPDGFPVYKKLGFELMEEIEVVMDGEAETFPAMMWWPPGTKEVEKVPLV